MLRGAARPIGRLVAPVVVLGALTGCPASGEEVRPPADEIFFPTGLAAAQDERFLFVASSNSDLRYDSGTLNTLDVEAVQAVVRDWIERNELPAGRDCARDVQRTDILECHEREFLVPGGAVRTGNFATHLAVQTLDSGEVRLLAPVRGDPSLTYADFEPGAGRLRCGGGGELPRCDDAHRLSRLRDDPDLAALALEPFGVFVDPAGGYGVITHLSARDDAPSVTILDAPRDGRPPVLTDQRGNIFAQDRTTGVRGAVGVVARPGGLGGRPLLYATSHSDSRLRTLYVHRTAEGLPQLVPGDAVALDPAVLPADDARGIAFDGSGDRLFVVNRNPAMLHVLDTSIAPTGRPRNRFLRGVELCRAPAIIAAGDTGVGTRVFVSCFEEGQLWIVDPELGAVEGIVDVGRGPSGVAFLAQRKLLAVANFLEHTLVVLDVTPGGAYEGRVALRIGRTEEE